MLVEAKNNRKRCIGWPTALCLMCISMWPLCISASVISDMNNMLRDADRTAAGTRLHFAGHAESLKRQTGRPKTAAGAAAEGEAEGETSVELLRFVDDDGDGDGDDNVSGMPNGQAADTLDEPNEDGVGVWRSYRPAAIATAPPSTATTQASPAYVADEYNESDERDGSLTLEQQVRLLSKQLNALTMRRREDYELLERNLRKSLRQQQASAAGPTSNSDVRTELDQLRHEVKSLRDGHLSGGGGNKERLTIEWLQQSVSELRKQLLELQQIANNAVQDVRQRSESFEDLATIRSDYKQLQLELAALRDQQQHTDVYVRELREELLQQEEEFRHLLHGRSGQAAASSAPPTAPIAATTAASVIDGDTNIMELSDGSSVAMLADHRRRHMHIQRQQIHALEVGQRQLKRQLNELKYHRIGERVRSIEIEQHRIADANFNLSRQIASLDKVHSSMLELLEDVESLQNKMDKSVPELRHEISKLEFSNAQLNSEQSLVREEGKNVARSLQAMAVSVSTLLDERDSNRQLQTTVTQLKSQVDRLDSIVQDVQRALTHRKLKANHSSRGNYATLSATPRATATSEEGENGMHAEALVAKLENVELEYESIVKKLPQDCGEATAKDAQSGLYLIAPSGQHHPLMAHCTGDGWTTVQRRFDGSADFNRSWADYARGFGTPSGEYWIGNEQLHHLTRNNCTELRILMQDIYDNTWLAHYTHFYISSKQDGYRLHIDGYMGNASNALDYQEGMQFSAIDVDRDISQTHCAANYEGGWWFSHCQHANLNGRYNLGLTWFDASRNEWIAVKSSQMLIRRQSTPLCRPATFDAEADGDGDVDAAADAVGGTAVADAEARDQGSRTVTIVREADSTPTATPATLIVESAPDSVSDSDAGSDSDSNSSSRLDSDKESIASGDQL